jgi:hypothetical protein
MHDIFDSEGFENKLKLVLVVLFRVEGKRTLPREHFLSAHEDLALEIESNRWGPFGGCGETYYRLIYMLIWRNKDLAALDLSCAILGSIPFYVLVR